MLQKGSRGFANHCFTRVVNDLRAVVFNHFEAEIHAGSNSDFIETPFGLDLRRSTDATREPGFNCPSNTRVKCKKFRRQRRATASTRPSRLEVPPSLAVKRSETVVFPRFGGHLFSYVLWRFHTSVLLRIGLVI